MANGAGKISFVAAGQKVHTRAHVYGVRKKLPVRAVFACKEEEPTQTHQVKMLSVMFQMQFETDYSSSDDEEDEDPPLPEPASPNMVTRLLENLLPSPLPCLVTAYLKPTYDQFMRDLGLATEAESSLRLISQRFGYLKYVPKCTRLSVGMPVKLRGFTDHRFNGVGGVILRDVRHTDGYVVEIKPEFWWYKKRFFRIRSVHLVPLNDPPSPEQVRKGIATELIQIATPIITSDNTAEITSIISKEDNQFMREIGVIVEDHISHRDPSFVDGAQVELRGLVNRHFNGLRGVICDYVHDADRYIVDVEGRFYHLKRKHLIFISKKYPNRHYPYGTVCDETLSSEYRLGVTASFSDNILNKEFGGTPNMVSPPPPRLTRSVNEIEDYTRTISSSEIPQLEGTRYDAEGPFNRYREWRGHGDEDERLPEPLEPPFINGHN